MSSESNNITTAPSSTDNNQHSTTSAVLPSSVRSPVFEKPREDLTSRLQKEFGLLVEADTSNSDLDQTIDLDEDGGGDATPEEDSPPPPPPSGSHLSGSSTRFLPSQIPSYTTQQPQQNSYPTSTAQASVVSSQPPPVPHVHHYSSNPVNRAKYPPPPPPPSSMTSSGGIGGYQVNFPPPPPPTSVSYVKDDHSQPPPQPLPPPPPAPLPALKQALNNGPGLTGSNSSRRPPSKDYYNRGSPGSGGGRGYYTSHRDRRDHGFRERDSNHGSRGGDQRDRGEPRDRHGSDRDYRSQSSSRRNAYQSRNYYWNRSIGFKIAVKTWKSCDVLKKLFVYPSSCLFTQQMPMFTGNTPLMMYCLRLKKNSSKWIWSLTIFPVFTSFSKHAYCFFLVFLPQGPLNLVLHDAPPPLFHKITTPRPHTHKKRSQMIPSSIRKNVQQNKYKFLFHVFFKKLLLSCYYSIITTHFIINTGNGITFFHHFR